MTNDRKYYKPQKVLREQEEKKENNWFVKIAQTRICVHCLANFSRFAKGSVSP